MRRRRRNRENDKVSIQRDKRASRCGRPDGTALFIPTYCRLLLTVVTHVRMIILKWTRGYTRASLKPYRDYWGTSPSLLCGKYSILSVRWKSPFPLSSGSLISECVWQQGTIEIYWIRNADFRRKPCVDRNTPSVCAFRASRGKIYVLFLKLEFTLGK